MTPSFFGAPVVFDIYCKNQGCITTQRKCDCRCTTKRRCFPRSLKDQWKNKNNCGNATLQKKKTPLVAKRENDRSWGETRWTDGNSLNCSDHCELRLLWDKTFLIMNTNHFYLPFVALSSGFRGWILMIVCFFALDSNQAVSNSHVSVCCRFKNRHLIGRTWSWGWWEYHVFCTNQNFDLVMELDDKSGRRVFILWGL